MSSAVASPITRPAFPRVSSSKSPFIFCGMALLPVEYASGRCRNPYSCEENSSISSAQRLKWSASNESALTNSNAKSRSLVASMLFVVGAANPSSCAIDSRSSGRVDPATAADPRGQRFARFRQSLRRSASRNSISTYARIQCATNTGSARCMWV